MSWMDQIGGLLQQYSGNGVPGNKARPSSGQVDEHFDTVANQAPRSELASGLSEAFRSNQTPPFEQMLAQLFSQSNDQQKAGILSHLLKDAGPGVLSSLGLSSNTGNVTPQQAQSVSPEMVQQAAAQAHAQDPSIVDRVSEFYAQHPFLIKKLGGMALTIALAKMAGRMRAI